MLKTRVCLSAFISTHKQVTWSHGLNTCSGDLGLTLHQWRGLVLTLPVTVAKGVALSQEWNRLPSRFHQHSTEGSRTSSSRGKTPIGKLDEEDKNVEEKSEKPDPYAPFPDRVNPVTGEVGGPTGPEPTRYGDWEKKGRVTDF